MEGTRQRQRVTGWLLLAVMAVLALAALAHFRNKPVNI